MHWSYIDVPSTDPAFNLALEQYVFDALPRHRNYFFLWQNDNAVIVGRHQNTLAEINEPYIREKRIRVVRRLSGGGAVYHDLGNLNFTFIQDTSSGLQLDLRLFCEPVAQAICSLGAHAVVNGRNDITIDGKKFSGNAQYVKDGRVMLGLDPLYCANEGKLICVVAAEDADKVIAAMHESPEGRDAALIGRVSSEYPGKLVMQTSFGGRRVLQKLTGAQLPRIC